MNIDDPEFDPVIAALYEAENPWGDDDDFFIGLLAQSPQARVVDLGCGTGRLAVTLAVMGHPVTGVEPNPAFLEIARRKPGSERVAWIRGTSADLPSACFDAALMTSHVAQVFLTDDEWAVTLADLRRALMPGALLAFDTRDPAARAWEQWRAEMAGHSRRRLPDGSVSDEHTTVTFSDKIARFEMVSVRSDGSRTIDPTGSDPAPGAMRSRGVFGYRFWTLEEVRSSLDAAGFAVENIFGGWHEERVGEGVGELVVVARAR